MDLTGRRETDPGVGLSPLTDPPSRISTPSSPGDAANSSFVTSAILAYSCRQAATARLAPLSTPGRPHPVNIKHLYDIYTMLDQRRRAQTQKTR